MTTKQLREMERQADVIEQRAKNVKKVTLDRYGNEINSLEESMYYISCRLDELTGNAMGISSLKVDVEPVEVLGIEDKLDELNTKVDKLVDTLDNIAGELQSLSTISETLENMLGWYIQFNEKNKK